MMVENYQAFWKEHETKSKVENTVRKYQKEDAGTSKLVNCFS